MEPSAELKNLLAKAVQLAKTEPNNHELYEVKVHTGDKFFRLNTFGCFYRKCDEAGIYYSGLDGNDEFIPWLAVTRITFPKGLVPKE
jgi:hypothetical protein